MKLYHITPKRNVDSILTLGLIPGYNRGLGKGCDVIFLTNDPEYILKKQAGTNWMAEHNPVVFCIDTESYQIEPCLYKAFSPPRLSTFEFICRKPIAAKHIFACSSNGKDNDAHPIEGYWATKT